VILTGRSVATSLRRSGGKGKEERGGGEINIITNQSVDKILELHYLPVSVTLKKNVIVITVSQIKTKGVGETSGLLVANKQVVVPSVRLSAIKNNANGGIPKRALRVAKAAERKTNGATILKIWVTAFSLPREYYISRERGTKGTHEEGCHQEWVKFRNQAIHWLQVERPDLCMIAGLGIWVNTRANKVGRKILTYDMEATLRLHN
jgi:hypothetical protein